MGEWRGGRRKGRLQQCLVAADAGQGEAAISQPLVAAVQWSRRHALPTRLSNVACIC